MHCQHRPSWKSYWTMRDKRKNRQRFSHLSTCKKCGATIELTSKSRKGYEVMWYTRIAYIILLGMWGTIIRQTSLPFYSVYIVFAIGVLYMTAVEFVTYHYAKYKTVKSDGENTSCGRG